MILEEIARAGVPVIPATIGKAVGLPKPTVHRLFQTAEAEGFLQRDLDGRHYGPGPRLRSLAVGIMSSQHMRTARVAILKRIAEEVGETCNLVIPDREGMVYLDRVETHWPLRIQLPVGTQVPFHCTASGKMYLSSLKPSLLAGYLDACALEMHTDHTIQSPKALSAELDVIRERGYSTDDQEFLDGMVAVAVPIFDDRDRFAAAIAVHAPLMRHQIDSLVSALPTLRKAAATVAKLNIS